MLMKNAALLIAPHLNLTPADLLVKLEYPPQMEMGDVSLPCFAFAR
jgi:arginyl-tRNA synthetase